MKDNKINKYQYMNQRSNEIIKNINRLKLIQKSIILQNEKLQDKISNFPTREKHINKLTNIIVNSNIILIIIELTFMLFFYDTTNFSIILETKNITLFIINLTTSIYAKNISELIIDSKLIKKDYSEEELIKLNTTLEKNIDRINQINEIIKQELKLGFSLEEEIDKEINNQYNNNQKEIKTLKLTKNIKK